MTAVLAAHPHEAMGQDAAAEVGREFVTDEGRQLAATGLDLGQEVEPVLLQGPVEQRGFRKVALVDRRAARRRVTARCGGLGKHSWVLSVKHLRGLLARALRDVHGARPPHCPWERAQNVYTRT